MSIDDPGDMELGDDWDSNESDDRGGQSPDGVDSIGGARESGVEAAWRRVIAASILGLVLMGGSVVILGLGVDHVLVPIGTGLGTIVLALGIYGVFLVYRKQSQRRHDELIQVIQQTGHDGPTLGTRAESLLGALRQQRQLTDQLLNGLPDQRQEMSVLIDELSKRNRAIEALFEDEFDKTSSGTGNQSSNPEGSPGADEVDTDSQEDAQSKDQSSGAET